MDARLQHERNVSRWQAVNLVFLKLFKEKLMQTTNGTESPHAQTSKELTTEALAMIVVMTIFAILSVLGSLSTAFEFLYKENFEEKKRRANTHKKYLNKLFQNSKRKMSNSDVNNKACTNNMQKNFKQYTITSDCFRKSKSFIQCFCFIKNGKFLFQTDPDKMQFDCLHGIRVISNFSIICFHVGLMSLYTSDVEVKPFLKSPISKLLFNAYFAVDAFFVLRWQSFGYGLASITIFLSSFTCFLLTKEFNLIYSSLVQFDLYTGNLESFMDRIWVYTDTLYYMPYTRISPYLLGVLSGYYFYGKKCKDIRNRWATLWFGWIAAMILIWISFFALLQREESLTETALYNSVKHLFFSAGLCWIIFVCITEQGRYIDTFLSCKFFLPFSKLSYCIYLIHMLIIQRDYLASQELEEFSLLLVVLYVLRVYFLAFVISIPGSLMFEIPIINLYDLYMKKDQIKKRETGREKRI